MSRKVGRNDPCPCGSGKKYKKCCLGRERPASPRVLTDSRSPMASPVEAGGFRMEPGSCAAGSGLYAPAVANFKRADDEWEYDFILVHEDEVSSRPEYAKLMAMRHLREAFDTAGGSIVETAQALRSVGYERIDGLRIAESEEDEGFSLYQTSYDEELGYNPRARAAILEIVENQLRDNDPPEARQAFERMIREGHPEEEAKRRIALLVANELFGIMKYEREFDQEGYVAALKRLPEVPEGLDDDDGEAV